MPRNNFAILDNVVETVQLETAQASQAIETLPALAPALPEPVIVPVGPVFRGLVTHYGQQYNGYRMGCYGEPYASENPGIIAVGPSDSYEWPCGTNLRVCGPTGCIVGIRTDSCPGCGDNHLDLSEAGINTICGDQAHVCRVGIEQVILEMPPPPVYMEMPPLLLEPSLMEVRPVVLDLVSAEITPEGFILTLN